MEWRELEVDVVVRALAREPYHVLREIHNANWFADVENENLRALAPAGGLHHQGHRFRDRHEEAARLRMGHLDRPAGGNLRLKNGDYAPVAAQDVSKTHRDTFGLAIPRPARGDDPLADAFGRAHSAHRVHGLVR